MLTRDKITVLIMYNLKSTIIIVSFVLGSLLIVIFSRKVEQQSVAKEAKFKKQKKKKFSEFSKIHLFGVQNNRPSLELKSEYLDIIENEKMEFIAPVGKVFSKSNAGKSIEFKSDEGKFNFIESKLTLKENVNFKGPTSKVKADQLEFYSKTSGFEASGSIDLRSKDNKTGDKISITSQNVRGNFDKKYYEYQGQVKGQLKRRRRYEPGVKFDAQKMIVDLQNSTVFMEGDVLMKRNKFDMLAGKAELFLENYNKSLKYYSLYDDIRLQERLKLKDGTEIVRKAFADKIEGYNHERKLVLTGSPRVIQGSDVIKGYKVTLRENLEMVEVDDSASSFTIKKKQK